MPLYDAFSSGSSLRMSRMSSVPSTEDLKYLLSESKKNGKPVELPFENNRALFVIKVQLVGTAQTPKWTFQRGDGASARVLWTRESAEVMMIQNKIKVESAYDSGVHDQQTASGADGTIDSGSQAIVLGSSQQQQQPIVTPVTRRNFAGWPQAPVDEPAKLLVPPKPLPLAGFTAEFVASKESWPLLKEDDAKSDLPASAAENLAQVRSFARKTVEQLIVPALKEGADINGSPGRGKVGGVKQVVEIETRETAQAVTTGGGAQEEASGSQSVTIPLPPPVQFDDSLVDHVFNRLFDRGAGLMSFGTLVFFLLREFDRFQRRNSSLSIVICEIALKRDGKMSRLPYEALPAVAERIRSVCQPHHIAAHVSGGEFAILLDEAEEAVLQKLAESLHAAISAGPELIEGLPTGSTRVAIGAASIPNTCGHPGVLVAAAEMAKEMAKGKTPSYLLFPARSDLSERAEF